MHTGMNRGSRFSTDRKLKGEEGWCGAKKKKTF
jgi:hypothetical protein